MKHRGIAGVGVAKSKVALKRKDIGTYYDVLGVPWNADEETIRTAFRKAAKSHHPDLNSGDPTAGQLFQEVVAAYELLKNPEQREAYDRELKIERRNRRVRFVSSLISGVVSGTMVAVAMWLWYTRIEPQSSRITTAAVSQPASEQATPDGGAGNGSGDDAPKGIVAVAKPEGPPSDLQSPAPAQSGDNPIDQPNAQTNTQTNVQTNVQTSLATEWEHLQADGDPMAIWEFVVRNPDTAESVLARSKLLTLIETSQDLFFLHVLNMGAPDAIAALARQRLVNLGALTAADNGKAAARDPPAGSANSLEQRATGFVSAQISAWSSTNPRQLAGLTKTYADEVFYNGSLKSRLAVVREKRRLQQQFSDRVNEALASSMTVECVANACRVAGAMEWKPRNAPRKSGPSGSARFEYGVLLSGHTFSILSENTSEPKPSEQAVDVALPPRLPVARPAAANPR